jgi:REP element-mobilizing transposase RayT
MKLFKSHDPNIFHYTTSVCYRRVPIFRSDKACGLLIEALTETREKCPFKLIGYVIMPDHAHLIVNPLGRDISTVMGRLKSSSARKIIDWLRDSDYAASLRKLELRWAAEAGPHTRSLAEGLFIDRPLEPKVCASEAQLHSPESGQGWP